MNIWLLLAGLIGPVLYWFISLNKKYRTDNFEDFHYAGRTIKPENYIDSTVMYAMQVAALTLFATWGFMYGIGTLWVPIFWGFGYWLLAKLIESGKLDNFLTQEHLGTIHQFLAEKSKWRLIGVLAAFISLFGILGPAMYEANFVGSAMARINTASFAEMARINTASELSVNMIAETSLALWLFVGFVVVAAIYMLFGGFKAIVLTDVWQLSIGFGGFSIFTAVLLYRVAKHGEMFAAMILTISLLLLTVWLLYIWYKNQKKGLSTLITLSLSLLGYVVALASILFNTSSTDTWKDFLENQHFSEPFGLGIMSLLSLLIANGLYQVVDVGQWQRLASVKTDETLDATKRTLARSIRYIMIYSPITWVIAIVFGMTLKYLMPELSDPYDAVGAFLVHYWSISQWLVILIIVAMIAIMLSTLDSLVAAITFTLHNDCLVAFKPQWRTLAAGRIVTVAFLVVGFYFYTVLSGKVSNFADILYTCWAFQIALFPLVMTAVFRNKLSAPTALASLVAGIFGSLFPLFSESLNPYEHSPTLSLLGAGVVMLIGNTLFARKK